MHINLMRLKEILRDMGHDAQPKGSADVKPGSPESTNNRIVFLDGARGLFALMVVYGHIIKFYTSFNIAESTTIYMTVIVIAGFFVQSAYHITSKFLSDLFKIPRIPPPQRDGNDALRKRQHFKAIYLLVVTYFIRRFLRVYLPFFFLCTAIKFGNFLLTI
jgi:hypothetical protein